MTIEPKFYGQEERDAHALAIGRIVMAWNEFQETLGQIYAGLFGDDGWAGALAKWQALNSDRAQRQMLKLAAEHHLRGNKRALEEFTWLIEQTDMLLADQRNVGVHAPLMSFTDEKGKHQILPLAMFGNRKASSLIGMDILAEYALYQEQIRKMNTHAIAMQHNLSTKRSSPEHWPDRPDLRKSAATN